jgi:hypothetical protein
VRDSSGAAFGGAAAFAAMLGLLDEVKAALAEAEFVATGAGDEDVMMPPLASASFPGALDATFPVLALARGVCDAGWGIVGLGRSYTGVFGRLR